MASFFQETLTSVLSQLTHLMRTRSPHANANEKGGRGLGRGEEWGRCSVMYKDNEY